MHVTRFGHSAVLVEAAGQRVLIDPGAFSSPEVFEVQGLDAIVVTHQHADHLDRDRIGALIDRNPGAIRLSDPETAAMVGSFTAHSDGDVTELGTITITGVGTTHAEILPMIPRVTNTGVLVTAAGEPTLFHPGDAYAYAPEEVDILAAAAVGTVDEGGGDRRLRPPGESARGLPHSRCRRHAADARHLLGPRSARTPASRTPGISGPTESATLGDRLSRWLRIAAVPLMLVAGALVAVQSHLNGDLAVELGTGPRAGFGAAVISFGIRAGPRRPHHRGCSPADVAGVRNLRRSAGATAASARPR